MCSIPIWDGGKYTLCTSKVYPLCCAQWKRKSGTTLQCVSPLWFALNVLIKESMLRILRSEELWARRSAWRKSHSTLAKHWSTVNIGLELQSRATPQSQQLVCSTCVLPFSWHDSSSCSSHAALPRGASTSVTITEIRVKFRGVVSEFLCAHESTRHFQPCQRGSRASLTEGQALSPCSVGITQGWRPQWESI